MLRTDEWIERELRDYLARRGGSDWPTKRELRAAGEMRLWCAMRDYGGSLYWCERLGYEPRSQQIRRGLTEEEALDEARAVVAELGYLPSDEDLRLIGRPKLATYISKHGGVRSFRSRLGLG